MIKNYLQYTPRLAPGAWVAEQALAIGQVELGANCSIWYNATLRGDLAPIVIGENSNIQDNSVVHVDLDMPTIVGNNVVVGHGATLHACTVEDNCLIGMGAVILDQAVIGRGSIVAAGSVVSPRTVIPPHSQVMGVPGRVVKQLDDDAELDIIRRAAEYVRLKNEQ